ncbi:MAG: YegP family protein [Acidimicrobiia bacterium]|nr:YegP family protein [Acidimicrobiia bacterium]
MADGGRYRAALSRLVRKFPFRLKASNGQIIAVGEANESKASARNGIDSVKRHAADTPVVDDT